MATYTFFTSYLDNSTVCQCFADNSLDAIEIWAKNIVKEKGFKRIQYSKLNKKINLLRTHKLFENVKYFRIKITALSAPIVVHYIKTSEEKEQGVYEHEEAVEATYNYLPKPLKLKFEIEDIDFILEEKFQYLLDIGYYSDKTIPDNEPDPFENYEWDYEAIADYVIEKAIEKEKYFTKEDLDKIFDAEYLYMKDIGIIEEDEDGEMKIIHMPFNLN